LLQWSPFDFLDNPALYPLYVDFDHGVKGRRFSFTSPDLADELFALAGVDGSAVEEWKRGRRFAGLLSSDFVNRAVLDGEGFSSLVDSVREGDIPALDLVAAGAGGGMQRLSECKTKEEAMQVISDAGVEIPDEMMEGISGGELFQTPWNPWFLGTLG
jgi:hypothetical protein